MTLFVRWVKVQCPKCGRVHCDATPGSKVRFRCKLCKRFRVVEV